MGHFKNTSKLLCLSLLVSLSFSNAYAEARTAKVAAGNSGCGKVAADGSGCLKVQAGDVGVGMGKIAANNPQPWRHSGGSFGTNEEESGVGAKHIPMSAVYTAGTIKPKPGNSGCGKVGFAGKVGCGAKEMVGTPGYKVLPGTYSSVNGSLGQEYSGSDTAGAKVAAEEVVVMHGYKVSAGKMDGPRFDRFEVGCFGCNDEGGDLAGSFVPGSDEEAYAQAYSNAKVVLATGVVGGGLWYTLSKIVKKKANLVLMTGTLLATRVATANGISEEELTDFSKSSKSVLEILGDSNAQADVESLVKKLEFEVKCQSETYDNRYIDFCRSLP
jgi:hypothetical protein